MRADQDRKPIQQELQEAERTSVTVPIGGEEYNLRVTTTADYALKCAAVVDAAIQEIVSRAALVDPHRAAILAALSLADRMFRAESAVDGAGGRAAERAGALADRIDRHLSAAS